jgi:hypothetical protein
VLLQVVILRADALHNVRAWQFLLVHGVLEKCIW